MVGRKKSKKEEVVPVVEKPKKVRKPKVKKDETPTSGSQTVTGTTPTEFAPEEAAPCECAETSAPAEPAPDATPEKMRLKIIVFAQNSFGSPTKFLRGGNPRLLVVENLKKAFFCNDKIDRLGRDTLLPVERNPFANEKTYVNYMLNRKYTVCTRPPTDEEMAQFGL